MSIQKKLNLPPSALAQTTADALWSEFPDMRPVGDARVRKNLVELDSILACTKPVQLRDMILTMNKDKWHRDWVASFERIAKELPRIKAAMRAEPGTNGQRESFVQKWERTVEERNRV